MALDETSNSDITPDPGDRPEEKPNRRISVILSLGVLVSVVAIVVCSYLLFNLFKDSVDIALPGQVAEQQAPTTQWQSAQPTVDSAPQKPVELAQQETATVQPPLPELAKSDEEVLQAASQINTAPKWVQWITTDEAIRKFVVVIDNLATGKIVRQHIPIPKPEQGFKSTLYDEKIYLDNSNFGRYSAYVNLFETIDNDMAAALYQRYSPLMEQAFEELGYADRTFHDTLMQAFEVLLSAPIINDDIELVRPSVSYKFADKNLEQAPAAHKQMIRMGAYNTKKLKAKIRQLQSVLKAKAGTGTGTGTDIDTDIDTDL